MSPSFKIELHSLLFRHDLELKSTEKKGEEIIFRVRKKTYNDREKYVDLSEMIEKETNETTLEENKEE